jgi:hypothetical protein
VIIMTNQTEVYMGGPDIGPRPRERLDISDITNSAILTVAALAVGVAAPVFCGKVALENLSQGNYYEAGMMGFLSIYSLAHGIYFASSLNSLVTGAPQRVKPVQMEIRGQTTT